MALGDDDHFGEYQKKIQEQEQEDDRKARNARAAGWTMGILGVAVVLSVAWKLSGT